MIDLGSFRIGLATQNWTGLWKLAPIWAPWAQKVKTGHPVPRDGSPRSLLGASPRPPIGPLHFMAGEMRENEQDVRGESSSSPVIPSFWPDSGAGD